jgi:hypothetical protein
VVAETLYKEDEKDFGTHGGRIVMDSNGIKYEETTVPYGVVPESANPRWVDDGDKEYLVCDILLWTGRYEDLEILLNDEEKTRPQSMEIKIDSSFLDDDGYEIIEDFDFSALTILGSDVEPCFEDAKVKMYELDEFKVLYREMIEAYSKISTEGGKNLDTDNKKEEFVEEEEVLESDTPLEVDKDDFVDEKEDGKDMKKEKEEKYELSYRDKMDILCESLKEKYSSDEEYVWVFDFTDTHVDYEKSVYGEEGYEQGYYRAPYTINEESKEAMIDFEQEEEMVMELITKSEKEEIDSSRQMALDKLNEKIESLESDLEQFTEDNKSLKAELEEEKKFRLAIEEEEKKEKIDNVLKSFEKLLSKNPEFEVLKDKGYELEIDELQKQCYILVGKDSFEKNVGKINKDDTKVYTQKDYSLDNKDDDEDIISKISKDYTKK